MAIVSLWCGNFYTSQCPCILSQYASVAGSSPSARDSHTSRTFTTQGSNESAPSVLQKGGAGRASIVSSTVPRGLERARFMVVAPVKDQAGNVVGVIQAINKAAPAVGWEHRPRVVGAGGTVVSARSGRSGHSSIPDDVSVRGPGVFDSTDAPAGTYESDATSPAERSSTSPDLHWAAAEALSVSLQVLLSAPRTPQSVSSAEPSAPSRHFAYTPKASAPATTGHRQHVSLRPSSGTSGVAAKQGVAAGVATSPTVSVQRGRSFRHSAGTLLSPSSSKAPRHPDFFAGLVSPTAAAAARDRAFAAAGEPPPVALSVVAEANPVLVRPQPQPSGDGGPADPSVVSFSKGWAAAAAALTEDLQSRQFVPFSVGDVATIESLAMSVGGCLHRAHMFEAVLRSQRKAEALLEIVRATASEQNSFFALARECHMCQSRACLPCRVPYSSRPFQGASSTLLITHLEPIASPSSSSTRASASCGVPSVTTLKAGASPLALASSATLPALGSASTLPMRGRSTTSMRASTVS